MYYELDGKIYNVLITKKNNKNTYLRIKNGNIIVTTSYLMSNKQIVKILNEHQDFLKDAIKKDCKNLEKSLNHIILGEKYDIITVDGIEEIDYVHKKVYLSDPSKYENLIRNEMKKLYEERLNYNYNLFEENIPFPKLTIRKMTSRWGVCNRKSIRVTLNSELFKYGIEELDYVIIHELSHLVHFNHSKEFWNLVSKYCPNYKIVRKRLKE